MNVSETAARAARYLEQLCSVVPNRRTGSPGNRAATRFFAEVIRPLGYEIDDTPFDCLDFVSGEPLLTNGDSRHELFVSPYSMGCAVETQLMTVSSREQLQAIDCRGKLLLMRGAICEEQLMPKHFVFYNPEHHQQLIALLEQKEPAALICATGRSPEQVGALYPFPLIVDGDFDIPTVHCTDVVGERLAARSGDLFRLVVDAQRLPAEANNVIAHLNRGAAKKILVTAHIDAYEDSPGASDNASGTVVLLLLAEMLSDYRGDHQLEIAAFNGEDHYSAAGEMDYLRRYGSELEMVRLAVNVDDVGYKEGGTAFSMYGCSRQMERLANRVLGAMDGLIPGDPWYSGDHMIFVQNGVPAIAFTAEMMPELMRTVTHTERDTPDLLEPRKLVELASALNAFVRSL
jgi:aminopeptidase YwaD